MKRKTFKFILLKKVGKHRQDGPTYGLRQTQIQKSLRLRKTAAIYYVTIKSTFVYLQIFIQKFPVCRKQMLQRYLEIFFQGFSSKISENFFRNFVLASSTISISIFFSKVSWRFIWKFLPETLHIILLEHLV